MEIKQSTGRAADGFLPHWNTETIAVMNESWIREMKLNYTKVIKQLMLMMMMMMAIFNVWLGRDFKTITLYFLLILHSVNLIAFTKLNHLKFTI